MNVRSLTAEEIADLLDAAWLADLSGKGGPDAQTRTALADRLGCDEDLRAKAWAVWRTMLIPDGCPVDEAEYWLDVEFTQPCPEDRPTKH